MEKKRFILFAMYSQYPFGGMDDAKESFDNQSEYKKLKYYENDGWDNFQVFDTQTFRTFKSYSGKQLPEVDFEDE